MTSIALPRITPTTYPLEQLFTDVGETLLSACTESTAQAFRKVVVEKLDAQGNVAPIQKFDADRNAEYTVYEDTYIQDVYTQEIYWDESQNTIRLKCLALSVIGIPIYIPGLMAWHLFQLVRCIGIVASHAISSASVREALELLPAVIAERTWAFISAVAFGIGMECACVLGFFKPYHGRKLETLFEKAVHHGVPCHEDIRHYSANPRTFENECNSILHSGKEYYLAYCFLVRAKLPHARFRVLRTLEV